MPLLLCYLPRDIAIEIYRLSLQDGMYRDSLALTCREYRNFVRSIWHDPKIASIMLTLKSIDEINCNTSTTSSISIRVHNTLLYPIASGTLVWYLKYMSLQQLSVETTLSYLLSSSIHNSIFMHYMWYWAIKVDSVILLRFISDKLLVNEMQNKPNRRRHMWNCSLASAAEHSKLQALSFLLYHNSITQRSLGKLVKTAIKKDNVCVVRVLLQSGADVAHAAQVAGAYNKVKLLRVIYEFAQHSGQDVCRDFSAILNVAVRKGYPEVALILLQCCANPFLVGTPLLMDAYRERNMGCRLAAYIIERYCLMIKYICFLLKIIVLLKSYFFVTG